MKRSFKLSKEEWDAKLGNKLKPVMTKFRSWRKWWEIFIRKRKKKKNHLKHIEMKTCLINLNFFG